MNAEGSLPAKAAALLEFERRQQLFDFRVDGWSAWRVVRNAVQAVAADLPLNAVGASPTQRALRALRHTLALLRIVALSPRRDLIVKTYRSALRAREGDRYRDVYFDGLLIRRPSSLKIEVVNSEAFAEQARHALRPADLDATVFTFWGRVLALALPRTGTAAFCARTARGLREGVDVAVSERFLLTLVSSVYWQARLYGLLLARVRPRAVLVADTGDYALRIACARRGVRFIELQHGVFDAHHADAVPDWVEGSTVELLLPDVLACYGQFWIEQLAGTRLVGDGVAIVGNELVDRARRLPRVPARPGEVRLLVTSQGLDSARLARWLEDVLATAPPGVACRLTVKLHPAYDEGSAAFDTLAAMPSVRVVSGAAMPNLWELLADADLHLSISSASHFDAAALDVPSIVVPLAGHERLLGAVDSSSIFFAAEPADIWSLAGRLASGGLETGRGERYAASGFIDNLIRLLEPDPRSPVTAGRPS